MDWYAVGISGAAGALAAMIATLAFRGHRERKTAYVVTFVTLFAVLASVGKHVVLPAIKVPIEFQRAERQLLELPVYAALREHDPRAYAAIMAEIKAGIGKGAGTAEVVTAVRPLVEDVVKSRLPAASDEAAVVYMSVLVREMRELKAKDPGLCYKFLFPQQHGALNLADHVSADLVQEDLAALAEVIRTSAVSPQAKPEALEVESDLLAVFSAVSARHGDNARLLENLAAAGVDPAVGCELAADLYGEVIALPTARAGRLLRFMLAQ
jgi:hypothetical protein